MQKTKVASYQSCWASKGSSRKDHDHASIEIMQAQISDLKIMIIGDGRLNSTGDEVIVHA